MTLRHGNAFHLAFPVHDLEAARSFYGDVLGCSIGREDPGRWIDFDFGGHQLSAHLKPEECRLSGENHVDGDAVPVRHFGIILPWPQWLALTERIEGAGQAYLIPPKTRFVGEPGEQGTFFLRDPSGNALEFKSFKDLDRLFAR